MPQGSIYQCQPMPGPPVLPLTGVLGGDKTLVSEGELQDTPEEPRHQRASSVGLSVQFISQLALPEKYAAITTVLKGSGGTL